MKKRISKWIASALAVGIFSSSFLGVNAQVITSKNSIYRAAAQKVQIHKLAYHLAKTYHSNLYKATTQGLDIPVFAFPDDKTLTVGQDTEIVTYIPVQALDMGDQLGIGLDGAKLSVKYFKPDKTEVKFSFESTGVPEEIEGETMIKFAAHLPSDFLNQVGKYTFKDFIIEVPSEDLSIPLNREIISMLLTEDALKFMDINVYDQVVEVSSATMTSNTHVVVDEEGQVSAKVNPIEATDKDFLYTSSDDLVNVNPFNGKFYGFDVGTANIIATSFDNKVVTATAKVTIDPIKVKSVRLNKTKVELEKGKKIQLRADVSPYDATNQDVTWKSSNKKVATVSQDGVVTSKGYGKAIITVTTKDGHKTAKCEITGIRKGTVTCSFTYLNVRNKSSYDSKVVGKVKKGSSVTIFEFKNGLYRIGKDKWVSAQYVKVK